MQLHFFSYQQNPLMDVSLSCFFYSVLSVSFNPLPLFLSWSVAGGGSTTNKQEMELKSSNLSKRETSQKTMRYLISYESFQHLHKVNMPFSIYSIYLTSITLL